MSSTASRFGAVAGLHPGTETIELRPPITGDPDACLKLLKSMQPRGLSKAAEPVVVVDAKKVDATQAVTGPSDVTSLIRKAHGEALHIEDLERGYTGRAQSQLAKAATASNEVTASDLDRVSPQLRKALRSLDQIVKRVMNRPSAARF
jgi:hypothetical protein